jgi:two-component system, NtrC family, C4-dicarboxylate transport sensor histidine kinase DctB
MPEVITPRHVLEPQLRKVAISAGAAVAAIGGYFFFSWISGRMTHLGFQTITIKTNASLCLLVCGIALILITSRRGGRFRLVVAKVLALISFIVGGLTLLEHLLGFDFGIDQLLATEPPGALGITHPNRMGPPGAISFTCAGTALLLLARGGKRAVYEAQWLAILLWLVALPGMIGYLYGVEVLYGTAKLTGIAWQTTIAIFLMGIGILCTQPTEGLMAQVTVDDPGGAAVRRLIPYALFLPILLGWLRLQGEWHGWYSRYFGTSILILSLIVALSILVFHTGRQLSRSSHKERSVEEEARFQRHLLQSVVDNMPAGVFLAKGNDLRILLVNRQYQAFAPGKVMVGSSFDEVWPETQLTLRDRLREVAASGIPQHAVDEQHLLARSPGAELEERYFSWSCDRVALPGAEGWGILGTVWETTERKLAEAAVRQSEEKFRSLFEASPDGILLTVPDGRIISANAAAQAMFGMSEEEIRNVGRRGLLVESEERLAPLLEERSRTGSCRGELTYRRKDGTTFEGDFVSVAFPDRARSFVIIRDISQRVRMEVELRNRKDELEVRVQERTRELSQALEDLRRETAERFQAVEDLRRNEQMLMHQSRLAAMGEMLANISHQWRQPLNVIGLLLQNLNMMYGREVYTKEYVQENVGRAWQLITHMSQTIDDFRNFLNPQREHGSFEIGEVVEKALSLIGEALRHVEVVVTAEGPIQIEGYRNEYGQVIMNILSNARDVFKEREVAKPVIRITIFKEDGKSVVTIADNAGGIPAEIMERIFDPYFTTKPTDIGTGIGLFMSRTIIEKNMGGSLSARNTDEGAEFRIEV